MTAHDPRVTLTEAEREVIWAGLRRARHEEAPIPLAHEFHKTHVLWAVSESVESIITARLAPIRALAEVWTYGYSPGAPSQRYADALRAALDAPVSASQDHDGAEGQGEGERGCTPYCAGPCSQACERHLADTECDSCPEDRCNATGKPWCTDEET